MRINHFGFLSSDLDKGASYFEGLGFSLISDVIKDQLRGVDILFLRSASGETIELVAPFREGSVVDGLRKKFDNSLYHICFETEDIHQKIAQLEGDGFLLIDTPKAAVAFDDRLVCFMYSKFSGIIELLETK